MVKIIFLWISYELFKKIRKRIVSLKTNIFYFNAVNNIIKEVNKISENSFDEDSNNKENISNVD